MNPTYSTIGLTLFVAALVVGMEQHREYQSGQKASARTRAWTQSWEETQSRLNSENARSSSNEKPAYNPFLTHEEQARIQTTLDLAHERLQHEHDKLRLSRKQRQAIFPLLVRSELDYDPQLPYPLGAHGSYRSLGKALSRAEYDALLSPFLTPSQEQEQLTQSAENESWWSHIIGRLEEDLNQQTETATQPIPIPLPETTPHPTEPEPQPNPEPTPETEAIAPSRTSLRGSRNLLDLLGS